MDHTLGARIQGDGEDGGASAESPTPSLNDMRSWGHNVRTRTQRPEGRLTRIAAPPHQPFSLEFLLTVEFPRVPIPSYWSVSVGPAVNV